MSPLKSESALFQTISSAEDMISSHIITLTRCSMNYYIIAFISK